MHGLWAAEKAVQPGRYPARVIWQCTEVYGGRYDAMNLMGRYAARVVWLSAGVYGGRYDAMSLIGRYAAMKLGRNAARNWLWEDVTDVRERQSCGIRPKIKPRYCKLSSE